MFPIVGPPILNGLFWIVLAILFWWGLVYALQRHFLFPAPGKEHQTPPPPGARVISLGTSQGTTEAWYLPPRHQIPGQRVPLLIAAHGNATLMDQNSRDFEPPRDWGMGVLLVEYPGYGRSAGSPSQTSITETFCAAYDWAIGQADIDPGRIIGHGRSLGGGAICQLSLRRSLAAMILESTFTSTRPFARHYGAPSFLIRDPFDNLEAVRSFGKPLIVFHGEQDTIVPFSHGVQLAAAVRAQLVPRTGGHNDLPRPWEEIRSFLKSHSLLDHPSP